MLSPADFLLLILMASAVGGVIDLPDDPDDGSPSATAPPASEAPPGPRSFSSPAAE
jgi:hypothetical protein